MAENTSPTIGAYCDEFRAICAELRKEQDIPGITDEEIFRVATAILEQRAADRRQMMIERRTRR